MAYTLLRKPLLGPLLVASLGCVPGSEGETDATASDTASTETTSSDGPTTAAPTSDSPTSDPTTSDPTTSDPTTSPSTDSDSDGGPTGWCTVAVPARHEFDQLPAGLHFGFGVAGAGDFDGDATPDLVVSGPSEYDGGPGRVWVLLGGLVPSPLPATADDFVAAGAAVEILAEHPEHHPGYRVHAAGDFDGDGLGDVTVLASTVCRVADPEKCPNPPLHPPIPPACEQVCKGEPVGTYLVLGRPGTGPIALGDVRAGDGGAMIERAADAPLIAHEAVVGGFDIDGDGRTDLALGDFGEPGAAVVFGHPLAGPLRLDDVGVGTPGFRVIAGPDNSPYLGETVAAAGDVDGDGLGDLMLADTAHGNALFGRVYLVRGPGPSTTPADLDALAIEGEVLTFDGEPGSWTIGGEVGSSLAGPGDLDGDGFDDLAMLAPNLAIDDVQRGRLYLVRGGPGLASMALSDLVGGHPGGTAVDAGDWGFGELVVAPGDVDGDGLADLLVEARSNQGAHLILLRGGPIDQPLVLGQDDRTLELTVPPGIDPGYTGLRETSALGDLDCDGSPELALGYGPLHLVFDPLAP